MKCNSAKLIKKLFGFTRQQLYHWRKDGFLSASGVTEKGYCHYTFKDFVALRTIRALKERGFSTYQIKKAFNSLRNKFPDVQNPFVQKPVVVIGNRIAIIDRDRVYDALSGQMLIIKAEETELWVRREEEKDSDISFGQDQYFIRILGKGAI